MKIYRRQEDTSYEVVANVYADGSVEGDSPTAKDLDDMLSGEGVYVPHHADNVVNCYLDEGMDMLLYLKTKLQNGYFQTELVEQDWEDMEEYSADRDLLDKQNDQGPPEDSDAPQNCNPEYLDEVDEAPEGAQVYDGVQEDTHFYCTNYIDIGAVSPDFEDDMDDMVEDINQRLEGQELADNEFITQKKAENTREGEEVIVKTSEDGDGLERSKVNTHMDLPQVGDAVMLVNPDDDSEGSFMEYSEWEDRVEGVVVKGVEGEGGGQWEQYERPRDIYSPEYVEAKQNIRDVLGEPEGVNSMYTYVTTFDNGERAIYKPESGNAYEESVRTDVFWYELTQKFSENPDYSPETAAADLKNGLGSAQKWLSTAETWQTLSESISSDDREELVKNNVEDIAEISVMDFITGNDDRHGGNLMADGDQIYAIDNGGYGGPSMNPSELQLMDSLNLLRELKDEESREQAYKDVIKRQKEILDEMTNNKDDVVNMARTMYGSDNTYVTRMRDMFEGDDPEIVDFYVEQAMFYVGKSLMIDEDVINEVQEEIR